MQKHYAFDEVLKVIVQPINPLRELDVLLSSIDQKRYPQITEHIMEFRSAQFKQLWTKTFVQNSIKSLNKIYDEILNIDALHSKHTLKSKALKHYKKTLKAFHELDEAASDEAFHELRIEFKVARYTLEFLSESAIKDEDEKIQECKNIQEYLGIVQDRSNQYEWLRLFCENNPVKKECKALLKQYQRDLQRLKKEKRLPNERDDA
jgi:CHAD domain-containing protein